MHGGKYPNGKSASTQNKYEKEKQIVFQSHAQYFEYLADMEFDGLDRKVQFGGDFGIAAVLEAAHLEDAARLGRHLGKRLPDDFMNLGRKERLRGEIFERGEDRKSVV